ncbi:hypothetical protein ACFSQD_01405 [Flavihumibacter stibioxidans]|uniref:Uncharacterized protein n=1 Tax=Flavihumibacter stibioxidans TaxID=1834163 RepID=A0ABR7MAR9_9BACT|nr:hypothetical protein [Flavihumibacter stibioxidans]MBC6492138.1 hypothetical protein [Flavihumibacter stibioxidans]
MKKLLVISLIFLHLFGNTELNQVFQIRQLLIHYYHHLQVSRIGFGEFIALHYGAGDDIKTDDSEEQSLPFMQIHHHGYSYAVLPQTEKIPEKTSGLPSQLKSMPLTILIHSSTFRGSPFKPPRQTGTQYL